MAKNQSLQPLSPEDVQRTVRNALDDAVNFMEAELQPQRELADAYYQGRTRLPVTKGRSAVIVTTVRDGVKSVIPSIARIFTQTDTIAEFYSSNEEDEKLCADATAFVNDVYGRFEGYTALISGSTDALKARVGVIKVWLEKKTVPIHSYAAMETGSGEDADTSDGNGPISSPSPATMSAVHASVMNGSGGDPEMPEETPGGQLTETGPGANVYTNPSTRNIWHLDPVPPEEFIVDPNAVDLSNFQVIAHRRNTTIGAAIALGFEYDDLVDLASPDETINWERDQRRNYTYDDTDNVASTDPTSRTILLTEAYIRLDADGDGIPELRRIMCGGLTYQVLSDEPVNYLPFAIFRSELQPHVFHPISLAEDLMQDQDAQTAMLRSVIDNTALVNSPRTEVNEQAVNLDDVKNGEIGAIVRVRQMGQINELTTPSTAIATLPVLQYLQEVSEKRSGITKLNQGLDPDALQSTAKVAAAAAVSAADARIEMMARNIGETGVKSLFTCILRVAMYDLKQPQQVRTQSGYQTVNPQWWHDKISVRVNVGLGSGRIDEKKMTLSSMLQLQLETVKTLGPANPLCSWTNVRETLANILRLSGIHNTTAYFPFVPPEQLKQLDQQQKQSSQQAQELQKQQAQAQLMIQKEQSAAMTAMAQAEAQKNQLRYQTEMSSLQQKHAAQVQRLEAQLMEAQSRARVELTRTYLEDDRQRLASELTFESNMAKIGAQKEQIAADAASAEASAEATKPNGGMTQ